MAINRYIITANVTVPQGTAATVVAGEPATGGAFGSAPTTGGPIFAGGITYPKGQAIMLDPAGSLYAAIGAGNLRLFVDGQDTVGHGGLHN